MVLTPEETEELPTRAQRAIKQFADLFDSLRKEVTDDTSVTDLTRHIIAKSGYEAALKEDGSLQARTRLENIEELLTATQEFESQTEESTLRGFLENVALLTEVDTLEEGAEAVPLMTLHSAKGLEFPVVFVVGVEEGLFPLSRAAFSPDSMELEEERRLCYVGMTRAKQRLFLTWARMRTIFGYTSPNKASRFLEAIPEHLLEGIEEESADDTTWAASAKETEALAEPRDPSEYHSGDRVRHPKFGEGIVVSADTDGDGQQIRVSIAFPGFGVKKLSLEYAPLERL